MYLSQGLPFGFFSQSLPVLLRQEGVSLMAIGSTWLLAFPWAYKFLWAPWVDRYGSRRFGHRRSWILPLQALSVGLLLLLGQLDPGEGLVLLFAGVVLSNLLAATQDIATDGLAVELLDPRERGLGNGVQVAGFRVGMILGGGLILIVFERLGREGAYGVLAAILALSTLPMLFFRESAHVRVERPAATADKPSMLSLVRLWRRPGMLSWLTVLALYKAGDGFGTAMLRPFLVDRGHTLSEIGWLLGTVGAPAGLLGALLGGASVARLARRTALTWFGALHASSLLGYAYLAVSAPSRGALYAAVIIEHFAGGMATVALFTCMMDRARRESAGTDYTVQASLSAGATGLFGVLSGLSAEALGYTAHFSVSCAVALLGAAVAWLLFEGAGKSIVEPQEVSA
jgi:RhtX/FptX family siderophore transporter